MKMKKFVPILFLLCAVCQNAYGAISYDLFFKSPSFGDANNAVVVATPGQFFTGVGVVLRETVTDGSTSILNVENVSGFQVRAVADGGDGSFQNFAADPTGGSVNMTPGDVLNFFAFNAFPLFQPGKPATEVGPGIFEVQLGTIDLIAPTTGATMFSLLRLNDNAGDIGTFGPRGVSLTGFDGGTFNEGSLTLTAIPEPSSIAAIAALGAFGAFRLRRKRKLAKTAAV